MTKKPTDKDVEKWKAQGWDYIVAGKIDASKITAHTVNIADSVADHIDLSSIRSNYDHLKTVTLMPESDKPEAPAPAVEGLQQALKIAAEWEETHERDGKPIAAHAAALIFKDIRAALAAYEEKRDE